MHGSLRHYLHLLHFLHGEHLTRAFFTHLPHLSEAALPHHEIKLEGTHADLSRVLSFVILSVALVGESAIGLWQVAWLVAGSEVPQPIEVDMPM